MSVSSQGRERVQQPVPRGQESGVDAWRSTVSLWWRTRRPRLDDAGAIVLGMLSGAMVVLAELSGGITARAWWLGGLTVLVSLGFWWRRRRPFLITLVAALAVSVGASLMLLPIVLLSLAVRRRGRTLVLGVVLCEVAYLVTTWPTTADGSTPDRVKGVLLGSALVLGLPAVVGAYVGARRMMVASLRERAERAESEQAERAERARAAERNRIAREMHDVLGHRISLVALHAGALELQPDLPPAEVERAATLIRTTAHQAMQELREVLGVLRDAPADPFEAPLPHPPQPSFADIGQLVGERAEAGMAVRLRDDLAPGVQPSTLVGRTAFRVVQESLTNAARHAPGTTVTVKTAGSPDTGLEVTVVNVGSCAVTSAPAAGSGLGLVGLRERVELVGGWLEAGPTDPGFVVRVWLPWRNEDPDPSPPSGTPRQAFARLLRTSSGSSEAVAP